MSFIDPRGFGDDEVIAWADRMVQVLESKVETLARLDDPEQWQAWAQTFFGEPDVVGQDAPDPYSFDRWQDYAERLASTQELEG